MNNTYEIEVKNRRSDENKWRWYDIGDHSYLSVTTILKWLSAEGLSGWLARTSQGAQEKIKTTKANRGIRIEKKLHSILRGEEVDPEEFWYLCSKFKEIVDKYQMKTIRQNFIVCSQHGYAGEVDDLVEIKGEPYIMDIKSGNTIGEGTAQISAYKYAWEEMSGMSVKLAILHCPTDQDIDLINKTEFYPHALHAFACAFDIMKYKKFYELEKVNYRWLGKKSTLEMFAVKTYNEEEK